MKGLHQLLALYVLIALVTGCAAPERGATVSFEQNRPRGLVQRTLENGLVILCQENHTAPLAVAQVFVRAGSIFEDEYLGSGISHLCEHIVSGGSTATRREGECRKILDELGGANNAYTSLDRTTYFIRTTAGENFDTALQLLADWMQNATFRQEEFDREREVIQREIEKGLTEPDRVLWNLSARTTYLLHPARHPVIGHKDRFQKLTRDDALNYYRRMYTPDNMVVVAVGDFDAARTADRIAELFQKAERSGRAPRIPEEDPPQQGLRTATVEMDVKSAYVLMSFRTVPLSHPDLYALDVMSYVLSKGDSSRLVQRLREQDQLVDEVDTWSDTPWYGAGRFVVSMVLKPENIEKAKRVVIEELEPLKRERVSEAELARAKKQKVADDVLWNQTIEQQAASLGGNYLATGNPFYDQQVYLRGIRAVRAEEIRAAAAKYLVEDNLAVAVVGPKNETSRDAETSRAELCETQKVVLPNGLRLLVRRNPGVPLVSMQAYFLAGVITEDETTAGVSHVLGQMLTRGTKSRTALDIARTFDEMAGSINGGSGNHTVFLSAEVLSEDFARAFEVFADCLLNPTFPEDELAKVKQLTLNALERQHDDWEASALDFLRSTLYKVSPYRLNRLGTEQSVNAITPALLRQRHRDACCGSNGVVAVFGDVDPDKVKALVTRLLGKLPAAPGGPPREVAADKPLTEDVRASRQTGRPGTAVVCAAYPAATINDADRYPLLVLDGVMSGIGWPGGWLHDELRGRGLVYVVHAYNFLGFRTPGYFGIYALTQPEKVDEVIAVIEAAVKRATTELVPEDEFERAKKMAITVELLERQTNAALGAGAALDELYGLGFDAAEKFADRVKAVTREDVLRAAQKYLTKRALVTIAPAAESSN